MPLSEYSCLNELPKITEGAYNLLQFERAIHKYKMEPTDFLLNDSDWLKTPKLTFS